MAVAATTVSAKLYMSFGIRAKMMGMSDEEKEKLDAASSDGIAALRDRCRPCRHHGLSYPNRQLQSPRSGSTPH